LERSVFRVQVTDGLRGWNARARRDERPEPVLQDEAAKTQTVKVLVDQQRRFRGFRRVRQDAAQDRWWFVSVSDGQEAEGTVVVIARSYADGKRSAGPIHQE